MVTAGTYQKSHILDTPERLDLALEQLFDCACEFGWELEAWSVLVNHYHFVALSPPDVRTLAKMVNKLHHGIAKALNLLDGTPGRRVMYQYFDTLVTHERSYLARLKYVHENPVHHGVVKVASQYPWCSAAWFEGNGDSAFVNLVKSFRIDRLHVVDDY